MVLCLLYEIVTFVSKFNLNVKSDAHPFLLENYRFIVLKESNLINFISKFRYAITPVIIIQSIVEYIDSTVLRSQYFKIFA